MYLIFWTLSILLQTSWLIQSDQAQVDFTIKNAGLTVKGQFADLKGQVAFDPSQPEQGQVLASVAVSTIDTGIGLRDRHLQGKGYFDAKTYPRITFTSTQIRQGDTGYLAEGTLSLKATQKSILVPFTFAKNVFKAKIALDRRDYDVGGNSLTLGDSVFISITIPVTSPSP